MSEMRRRAKASEKEDAPTVKATKAKPSSSSEESTTKSGEELTKDCSATKCSDCDAMSEEEVRPMARQRSTSSVEDLPDLTQQLVKAGIYEEYCEYRDNYRKWRKGEAVGARGEVTNVAKKNAEKDPNKHEAWFPTPKKFHFFFTTSYWGAILSLEGSLFFTLTSALPYIGAGQQMSQLIAWCNFVGASIFSAAVYFFYFQLINLEDTELCYLFPSYAHWKTVLQHVQWDSFMGTMTYAVSSIIYQVMVFLMVLPSFGLPEKTIPLLGCLGGFGFLIGGLCEVSHTCFGEHSHWGELGSVVGCLNCIGGVGFFLGGAAEFFAHDYHGFINFNYVTGSAIYTVASALLLLMWQGNDFGGTLLDELNLSISAGHTVNITSEGKDGLRVHVKKHSLSPMAEAIPNLVRKLSKSNLLAKDHGDHETKEASKTPKKKLSIRGVLSLCIYCWLFVCASFNFLLGMILLQSGQRAFSDVAMTLVWLLAVKVVLVVHSAITTVPNEQPYRFAMQSMWFLLVFAAAIQTISLVTTLPLVAGPIIGHHAAGPGAVVTDGHGSHHGGEL